jgi:hypothetical protein
MLNVFQLFDTAISIFKVNVFGGFGSLYIDQAVDVEVFK